MLQIEFGHHRNNGDRSFSGAVSLGDLSDFANRHKLSFAISGSLARNLFSLSAMNENSDVCSAIGPLSDVDLLVRDPGHQSPLVATLRSTFPILNFFHLETRVKQNRSDHPYRRLGNIRIMQAPEIWFGSADNSESGDNVHNFSKDDKEAPQKESINVAWIARRPEDATAEAFAALLDLLFLLRHELHGNDIDGIVQKLVEKINSVPPSDLGNYSISTFERHRRLKFAILKFICSRPDIFFSKENDKRYQLREILSELKDINQESELLKILSELALAEESKPFCAMIVPKSISQRWIRDVVYVRTDQDQKGDLKNFLGLEADRELLERMTDGGILSPVFELRTEDPPDPHCCDYRDFSRGRAEAVWIDPPETTPQTSPVESEMQQLMTPIFSTEFNELAITHSYQFWGPVNSVRLDYGHICALAGHSQPILLQAIRNKYKKDGSDND